MAAVRVNGNSKARGASRAQQGENWLQTLGQVLVGTVKLGLGVLVVAVLGLGLMRGLDWLNQPVREVVLVGDFQHISKEEVADLVSAHLHEGILKLDMESLVGVLEGHAWIASAAVSRLWPNRVQIEIEEHRPAMRWSESGLISEKGTLIDAPPAGDVSHLPVVYSRDSGPLELMVQFRVLAAALDSVGLRIEELRESRSGDWQLRLANGIAVELGDGDLRLKIQRVIRVWNQELADQAERIAVIDARYQHGLAVRWRVGAQDKQRI